MFICHGQESSDKKVLRGSVDLLWQSGYPSPPVRPAQNDGYLRQQ